MFMFENQNGVGIMRTALERGPKGKKFVAYAIDWPGLERNGKTPEVAFEHMGEYRSRYATIADRAGLQNEFAAESAPAIVIEYEGVGSTDFWGISFAHSEIDHQPVSLQELDRQLSLLESCWSEFDAIALRVSPELQKGPRGGGRDRDHIVRHLLATEIDWVKRLDIRPDLHEIVPQDARRLFHAQIVEAIRDLYSQGIDESRAKGGPAWTHRFLIRHLAYHVLDHAWEMEDKDLTGKEADS